MSAKRLIPSAVALLALTGTAALFTVGIAAAQGEQHHNPGRSYHTANAGATAQPRPVAAAAGSACAGLKSAPSSAASVAVNGYTVRVPPVGASASSGGPGEAKKPAPSGTGSVAVNGHTVRVIPTGTPAAGPC
jgi:hypothetical protein